MSQAELIKQLRDLTGAGVMDAKKALDDSNDDLTKAKEVLKKSGASKAAKRADRTADQGLIEVYNHNGKVGVMVEINCETDFVARNDQFKEFAHDVALHLAALKPETVNELLEQPFVKDPSQTIGELLNNLISKTGEKVVISRFVVYKLGEE